MHDRRQEPCINKHPAGSTFQIEYSLMEIKAPLSRYCSPQLLSSGGPELGLLE